MDLLTHPLSGLYPSDSLSDTQRHLDTISLRNLSLKATLGLDAWARTGKPQPVVISLQLFVNTATAGASDDLAHTFSYGQIAKDVTSRLDGGSFTSIDHLTTGFTDVIKTWPGEVLKINVVAPKALLRVEGGLGRQLVLRKAKDRARESDERLWLVESHEWTFQDLKIACIIGVNPHERLEKQTVVVNLRMQGQQATAAYAEQVKEGPNMWRRLVKKICEVVEPSEFQTLEALAARIAKLILEDFPVPKVTVGLEKPSALTFVEGAGVTIVRDRNMMGLD